MVAVSGAVGVWNRDVGQATDMDNFSGCPCQAGVGIGEIWQPEKRQFMTGSGL